MAAEHTSKAEPSANQDIKTKLSYIFLAPGVEEMEAMAIVGTLRHADLPVVTVAVSDTLSIRGATGQTLVADLLISEVDISEADWLIFPGGDPGAWNLYKSPQVREMISTHYGRGGRIAAICASPAIVLARMGVLKGKKATCYPALRKLIEKGGGEYDKKSIVVEPGLITSEGPAMTIPFAIEILRAAKGDQAADAIASAMLMKK